jgi:hypothetical protein
MMRGFLLPLLLLCGCAGVPAIDRAAIDAELACDGARAVFAARKAPTPEPTPAGICPGCNGKGYVGDQASIRVRCERCKGTGKVDCQTGRCEVRR